MAISAPPAPPATPPPAPAPAPTPRNVAPPAGQDRSIKANGPERDAAYDPLRRLADPDWKPNDDPTPAKTPGEPEAKVDDAAPSLTDDPTPEFGDAKPEPDQPPKPEPQKTESGGIKQVRAELDRVKTEAKAAVTERDQLKAKVAELERKAAEAASASEEAKTWREKHTKAEEELRYHSYTSTEEYREKYAEPLNKTREVIKQDLQGFMVDDGNGGERQVTLNDIAPLFDMPTIQATVKAKELFGDASAVILQHRTEWIKIANAAREAQTHWRQNGAQEMERRAKAQAQIDGEVKTRFEAVLKESEKHPDFVPPDPTKNADEHKAFIEGDKLVRQAYLKAEMPDGMTPQEQREWLVKKQSNLATRARMFPVLNRRVKAQALRIAELEKQVKEFRASEGETVRKTPKTENGGLETEPTAEGMLARLNKFGR
jgi:cell division septum initiation protein DivIVA